MFSLSIVDQNRKNGFQIRKLIEIQNNSRILFLILIGVKSLWFLEGMH